MQGELVRAGVLNQKMAADAQSQYLNAILLAALEQRDAEQQAKEQIE